MNGPTRVALCSSLLLAAAAVVASAQVNLQPTPAPVVTAENETWYQSGAPVMFAGNVYYPAGAAIHFLENEMVRSGVYQGIPLYSRTTIEPYSVVFVPAGGGMMQPYERRRAGELAGTSGSSVSSLPVEIPTAGSQGRTVLQAPAPPLVTTGGVLDLPDAGGSRDVVGTSGTPSVGSGARAVATSGGRTASRPAPRIRRDAPNGIFVEFQNRRWFSSGPPAPMEGRQLTRIGDWHGFPVYAAPGARSTIYIPIVQGSEAMAPYTRRR